MSVNRETGLSSVDLTAYGTGGYVTCSAEGAQVWKTVGGGFQLLQGKNLYFVGTGDKVIYFQNNAGNATVRTLAHDQFDRIALGPNNVIMVGGANSDVTLAFFGQTLRTKRTVSGSCYGNPACSSLMTALGDSGYGLITDSTTAGVTTATQAVSSTPSLGTCDASARGQFQYVDDTNDGAVSRICFCGTAADDSTYAWRRADAPGTTCP